MPTYKEKKQKLKALVKKQEEERVKQIQQHGHQFKNTDAFRIKQKQYKHYQHRQTNFTTLVDYHTLKKCHIEGVEAYALEQPEGAFLVKKFIDLEMQFQVGFEAMNDFVRKPYRNNLDGTNGLYLEEEKQEHKEQNQEEEKKQKKEHYQVKTQEELKEESQPNKGYFFNDRIRMANLGYQYDWPHRCYPKTKVPIPPTVTSLTKKAQALYQQLSLTQNLEYHGQAVIVNYYKPKEYMIGHLDDGEEDQINPIFSFNFGLSCVFLMGFPDKSIPPLALRLQAGDLLIMSGFSRICYHGVPRIIEYSYSQPQPSKQLQLISEKIDNQVEQPHRLNGFKEIVAFYKTHRLNINTRQVWSRKQSPPQKEQTKQEDS